MKKVISVILSLVIVASFAFCLVGCGEKKETLTLNVYNWGEFISDGSEGSFYTVKEFEKWYEQTYGAKVRVNHDTFTSNEDMYAKLSSGAVSYDVIIPSDYMIARMREESMLEKLDFNNIPNYKNIEESFRGLYFDPENEYTVPYSYGIVGIIYNANVVDEADAKGWELLWNQKYAKKILQFNNSRDAFGTAMYKLGIDVNTTNKADWDRAFEELQKQKPLRYGLVMDEIFNYMESGEAAIGAYYAGDFFTMKADQAENVDLRFYYPENTNFYVDAMCVPKGCKNKQLAEIFIDYMLTETPAVANAEATCYASPNKLVVNSAKYKEDMGEDAIKILYPPMESFAEKYDKCAYKNLDSEMLGYINSLWEKVKNN